LLFLLEPPFVVVGFLVVVRVHLKRPGTLGHDKIGLGRVVALCSIIL